MSSRGARVALFTAGIAVVVALLVAALGTCEGPKARDAERERGLAAVTRGAEPAADAGDAAEAATPRRRARAASGADGAVAAAEADALRIAGGVSTRSAEDQPWRSPPDAEIPPGCEVVVLRAAPVTGAQGIALDPASEVVARVAVSSDGTFDVEPPGAGAWDLEARAPGRLGTRVCAQSGASGVALALDAPAAAIRIRIRARPAGEPVAGARVVAGRGGISTGEPASRVFVPRVATESDARGEARVALGPGEAIVVVAPGFGTRIADGVRDGADVWLTPGDRIGGLVRDATGAPVAGAEVRVSGTDARGPWRTSEDGTFSVEGVPVEGGEVAVRADEGVWEGEVPAGTMDAAIVLVPPLAAIRGTVLLPDGTPAAGADVSGFRTTPDGRFSIAPRAPGPLHLLVTWYPRGSDRALADALVGEATVEVPANGAVDDVTVRLRASPRSWVVVRVTDADGRPVPAANLAVRGGVRRDLRPDATVLLVPLPPGTDARVLFDEPGRARVEQPVRTVGTPDADPVEIRVPALRTLRADVEFEGGAGPPVHPAPGNTSPRTVVRLAARWWWGSVPAVEFGPTSVTWRADVSVPLFVAAKAPGFAEVRRAVTPEEVAAGRFVVRMVRGSTVRCRLVGPETSATEAEVVLVGAPDPGAGARRVESARRDDDGAVVFENVESGRWTLVVRWPVDLVAVERTVDVAGAADLGDVAIPATVMLRGTVALPDGRPAGGAEVRFHQDGDRGGDVQGRVRSDGTFAIQGPRATRGVVRVARAGSGTAVVRVEDASAPLRLRLAPEGRLEVRIRLPAIVGGAWGWNVRTPDGTAEWQPPFDDAQSVPGFDRVVVFRGLAPGPIVAVAEGLEWRLEAPATVVAGETATVVLDGRR